MSTNDNNKKNNERQTWKQPHKGPFTDLPFGNVRIAGKVLTNGDDGSIAKINEAFGVNIVKQTNSALNIQGKTKAPTVIAAEVLKEIARKQKEFELFALPALINQRKNLLLNPESILSFKEAEEITKIIDLSIKENGRQRGESDNNYEMVVVFKKIDTKLVATKKAVENGSASYLTIKMASNILRDSLDEIAKASANSEINISGVTQFINGQISNLVDKQSAFDTARKKRADLFQEDEKNNIKSLIIEANKEQPLEDYEFNNALDHCLQVMLETNLPDSIIDEVIQAEAIKHGPSVAPNAVQENVYRGRTSIETPAHVILFDNKRQEDYANFIQENILTFATGPAGTKKTFIAVAKAVELLNKKSSHPSDHATAIKKIIIARPAIESGPGIGFLPGTAEEKLGSFVEHIKGMLTYLMGDDKKLDRAMGVSAGEKDGTTSPNKRKTIEVMDMGRIRGATLDNTFVILDEAQNATEADLELVITRIGKHSKIVVTGDTKQTDLKNTTRGGAIIGNEYKSGLVEFVESVQEVSEVAVAEFQADDVVRSKFVRNIVKAREEWKENKEKALEEGRGGKGNNVVKFKTGTDDHKPN